MNTTSDNGKTEERGKDRLDMWEKKPRVVTVIARQLLSALVSELIFLIDIYILENCHYGQRAIFPMLLRWF